MTLLYNTDMILSYGGRREKESEKRAFSIQKATAKAFFPLGGLLGALKADIENKPSPSNR